MNDENALVIAIIGAGAVILAKWGGIIIDYLLNKREQNRKQEMGRGDTIDLERERQRKKEPKDSESEKVHAELDDNDDDDESLTANQP